MIFKAPAVPPIWSLAERAPWTAGWYAGALVNHRKVMDDKAKVDSAEHEIKVWTDQLSSIQALAQLAQPLIPNSPTPEEIEDMMGFIATIHTIAVECLKRRAEPVVVMEPEEKPPLVIL